MSIDWAAAVLTPLIDVFGEPVIYMPYDGSPFSISGVFDDAYEAVSLIGGNAINSSMPLLGVRLADFIQPPEQDDTLIIQRTGESFVVKDCQPDSHGGAKLLLQLAPR